MILTHGANSISGGNLDDFLFLSYGVLNQGEIVCKVGTCSINDTSNLESAGMIDTRFGKMNFLKRNSTTENYSEDLRFNNDFPMEYITSNAIQIECIAKLDSHYYFYRFLYNFLSQDLFQRGNPVNLVATVIQSNTYYPTDRYNNSAQSDYWYNSGYIGNYFTKVKTKTMNLSTEFHHYCCTIDFPNKTILAWIDGNICYVFHLDDYIINWYSSRTTGALCRVLLAGDDRVSQICARKAIWTEARNYEPPTKPYV